MSVGTAGQRLKEAGNINKSLAMLGRVISMLAKADKRRGSMGGRGDNDHIPFRCVGPPMPLASPALLIAGRRGTAYYAAHPLVGDTMIPYSLFSILVCPRCNAPPSSLLPPPLHPAFLSNQIKSNAIQPGTLFSPGSCVNR